MDFEPVLVSAVGGIMAVIVSGFFGLRQQKKSGQATGNLALMEGYDEFTRHLREENRAISEKMEKLEQALMDAHVDVRSAADRCDSCERDIRRLKEELERERQEAKRLMDIIKSYHPDKP